MQFRDTKAQYVHHKRDFDTAINRVLESSQFIGGIEVDLLENELAQYVGVRHVITCANGTDAMRLALKTWNIGPGDAVFVPNFTFFASAEVVVDVGAHPVFVDVDPVTFNINPDDLVKAINEIKKNTFLKPKVVITVDLYGLPADYAALRDLAKTHQLLILEDAAQGFGGGIDSIKSCAFGDIATTSFFPSKPLGCYGDGGALFTNNDDWALQIRSLCCHGKGVDKYDNVQIGCNSRLDSLQAAILRTKLHYLSVDLDAVNLVANWYNVLLDNYVGCPHIPHGYYSSWAQYTIIAKNQKYRDILYFSLRDKNIPAMIYYPKTMQEQRALSSFLTLKRILPVSSDLVHRVLSLPIHPYLSLNDIEAICQIIKKSLCL